MKNRLKSATPAMRNYVVDRVGDVELNSQEQLDTVVGDTADTADTTDTTDTADTTDTNIDDDSWLDSLTPYEVPQDQSNQGGKLGQQDDYGTSDQQQRLADLYANLEHIDEDVASELDSKLLAPIRAEVNELKALRQQELEQRRSQLLSIANSKINAKYPKAEKILRSKQFKDYVNSDNDPYSAEQAFDRITRAYYAGDGDYVVKQLDAFVASRGKPKPPVGVEPHQGSGGNSRGNVEVKRPMTEAEYMAKRQAIRAAPRGTYPPNALKQLAEQYQLSRG